MATKFNDLTKEQIETLTYYTEIILAMSDSHKSEREAKDKSVQIIINDIIISQRAQARALETLAFRLWDIDLWSLWRTAPDDFIGACEQKLRRVYYQLQAVEEVG